MQRHGFARLHAAQISRSFFADNAGFLAAAVLCGRAKGRNDAIGHANDDHGLVAGDHIETAVANRALGQGGLGN
ncbi:hypothetical protein D3C84_1126820 [compost metagenome]